MKFKYKIDNADKIITEVWPEEFIFEDYQEFKEQELKDPEYNSEFAVISDLRNLKMGFNEEMTESIVNLIKSFPNYFQKRKSAIITNSPEQVVNSFEYIKKIKDKPIEVNIFSTAESAYKWIKEANSETEKTYPGNIFK